MHFRDFWMILNDLVILSDVEKGLVLSYSAISSRSNRPNSRIWLKTSFFDLWIIQNGILLIFGWSFKTWLRCQVLGNIEFYFNLQYQVIPTDQTRENGQKPLFCTLDHSKMHFRDFWMICYDLVELPNIVKHIVLPWYAISSQSINPKSRKPCFWHFGSFKNAFLWLLNDPKWSGSSAECSKG